MPTKSSARLTKVLMAALSFVLVFAASVIGSLATFQNIPTWYAHLAKPGFTPPNWLFGPAWTLLYILMAVAFWRILTLHKGASGKGPAIFWFLIQLILNALWSVAFFGLHSPLYGLVVIGLMIIAIIITMIRFFRLDPWAGIMLVPYLAWVSFASALNAAIFFLNR
jgi:benzodiazapine receptor